MTELFAFFDQNWSCQGRDDGEFGKATARSDGAAPESGQAVTTATADFLDEVELAQSPEVACGTLQRSQRGILGLGKELEALEGVAVDLVRPRQFVRGAAAG